MSLHDNDTPPVGPAGELAGSVCIGQIAALAALSAEMTALSTMLLGLPHTSGPASAPGQPGARVSDPDPEDRQFDNMPV